MSAAATDAASDDHGTIRPREGSSLHYALLWTAPDARTRLLDRLALIRTVARTLDDVNDRGVAERKVHWWHEELARLESGEPRHPRTEACLGTLGGLKDATTALLDILSVAATTRYTPPPDDEELKSRLVRDQGARLALLAHAASGSADDLRDPAIRHDALATGLGLHDALARLPSLLHRGFAVFPETDYARHGVSPATLARHVRQEATDDAGGGSGANDGSTLGGIPVVTAAPDRRAIVAASVDAARAALDTALDDPAYHAVYSRAELGPIARLAALRARQLRLWQERAPDLLRETVTPTPLAKFLVAWRHRRGARRPRVH